jgi:hypothetical protein
VVGDTAIPAFDTDAVMLIGAGGRGLFL